MKKTIVITFALLGSFLLGFAFNSFVISKTKEDLAVRKVTGIGGIFFKCKDPQKVRDWYKKNLGLEMNQYGCVFEWRQALDATQKGFSQWSPFSEKTKYFDPSTKDFMINYRVENLEKLVIQLVLDGVTVTDKMETFEYGKFIHILDIEGNKIELWEPNDIAFDKLGKKMGSITTK